MDASFKPIADHAVLVTFAEQVDEAAHAAVIALDRSLANDPPEGMDETVPALVNLLVTFDVAKTDHAAIEHAVRQHLTALSPIAQTGNERVVEICYEAPFGPDLDAVAAATGLSPDAVIAAHLSGDYRALMYGFSPGYAYLAGVPEGIRVPRKPMAVRDVAAGSVVIAGPQCIVTTLTMPTGWSILGRSPTQIFTGDPQHPFLFDVGDGVVFKRIDVATFERLSKERAHG